MSIECSAFSVFSEVFLARAEEQFTELLAAFGMKSPNDYPDGFYMKLVYVAFKP